MADSPSTPNPTTDLPPRADDSPTASTGNPHDVPAHDISAHREIEAQLRQTAERFALAAEAAGIGVWELDIERNTFTWDEQMFRLYGVERAAGAQPYALWADRLHPDDRERAEAEVAEAIRGEREFDTEFRIVRPDREVHHLKAAARVQRDVHGRPTRMTGVNLDVTVRKRAELDLFVPTSLLHTVLESASEVAIIATDPNLNILVFNAGARRLLGYSSEDVVGRTMPILIHDADEVHARGEELSAQLDRPVMGVDVFVDPATLQRPREWTYLRKDRSRVTVSLVMTAMRADGGELFGYLGVAHDITRQKQFEESMREAMLKAEQASLAKSQFLANMSHEIRTPMNAVIGLSYLLGQTTLDHEQAAFLAKLRLASKSLLGIINDVLDLSKIEAGELMMEHVDFSLDMLLQDLADVMTVAADAKGINFEIDAPVDLPKALNGDAKRVGQILTNLLTNAIKFTDHGQVQLQVRQVVATSQNEKLCFTVRDSGIGIAPDVLKRLFTPFAQADVSTTRRFGGTGLGLSIVKHLTNMMGGHVGMASTPSVGSEFWVVLDFPLAAADSQSLLAAADAPLGEPGLVGVRVLVVDDSDINLDVARHILELEGAKVSVANNGLEAVACIEVQPLSFDVVLMDVQMPVLDGHEATRRIRTTLELTQLPIIALTAGALVSERQRATAAGMDDFITKPFEVRSLVRTIRRYVKSAGDLDTEWTDRVRRPKTRPRAAWPQIDGIDANDASKRLGGDLELFRSLLGRFLAEFTDTGWAADATDAATLDVLAGRMHKLKGSAGNLGAVMIPQLASKAEAACRANEPARFLEFAASLAKQLDLVRRGAAPLLQQAQGDPAGSAATRDSGGDQLDPSAISNLLELLRQQKLSAVDCFTAISPQLMRLLGKASHDRVRSHLDNLQFQEAAVALEMGRQ